MTAEGEGRKAGASGSSGCPRCSETLWTPRIHPGLHSFVCTRAQSLSRAQLFVTPQTVACQAPLSTGFSGKTPGVGCHFLLQGIFLIQDSNPHLLYSVPLGHLRSLPSLQGGSVSSPGDACTHLDFLLDEIQCSWLCWSELHFSATWR